MQLLRQLDLAISYPTIEDKLRYLIHTLFQQIHPHGFIFWNMIVMMESPLFERLSCRAPVYPPPFNTPPIISSVLPP